MLKVKRSRFIQALAGFGTLGGFGVLAGMRSIRVDAAAKVYRWFKNQSLLLQTVSFVSPGWAWRHGAGSVRGMTYGLVRMERFGLGFWGI